MATEEDIELEAHNQFWFLKGGGNLNCPRHPLYRGPIEPTQGELRRWARAQGLSVNARGSLPARIRRAYFDAHREPA